MFRSSYTPRIDCFVFTYSPFIYSSRHDLTADRPASPPAPGTRLNATGIASLTMPFGVEVGPQAIDRDQSTQLLLKLL